MRGFLSEHFITVAEADELVVEWNPPYFFFLGQLRKIFFLFAAAAVVATALNVTFKRGSYKPTCRGVFWHPVVNPFFPLKTKHFSVSLSLQAKSQKEKRLWNTKLWRYEQIEYPLQLHQYLLDCCGKQSSLNIKLHWIVLEANKNMTKSKIHQRNNEWPSQSAVWQFTYTFLKSAC